MSTQLTSAVADNLLSPSAQYRREAAKAVSSIGAFLFVYLLLFLLSLCLVALCLGAGVWIVTARFNSITLLVGLGVMGCGVMVFVFLIKFLFASSRTDEGDSMELKEEEHPDLFRSIRSLARQIGIPMPKKVFVSPDVNASVFYNSSFWSLFLPVRKNLKIGLGLINSVNVSELEAVIAHEFGHFSQRSMKAGSWVYQVNKIIYDLLFNNQRFAESLSSLANTHGVFQFFGLLTVKIIEGIQWVLRQMYRVVNKSYLGLSRQMEFHADLVAASVCGGNNIISALRRIEFATECYNTTIEACNKAWLDKRVATDLYAAHSFVMKNVGNKRQLPFDGGLPVLREEAGSTGSRVNYKDQWSSHPTVAERQQHLEPFGLVSAVDSTSAWALLKSSSVLKERLTAMVYRNIPQEEVKETLATKDFCGWLGSELERRAFPPLFQEYYDQRQVEAFDVDAAAADSYAVTSFAEVLDEETASLPKVLRLLQQDIYLLQVISSGQIDARSFDFDGQKYKAEEAQGVIARLRQELADLEEKLKDRDRRVFCYFHAAASLQEAEALRKEYKAYFQRRAAAERFFACANALMEPLEPVFRGATMPIESIREVISELKREHEPAFKAALRSWSDCFSLVPGLQRSVENFLESDYRYFHEQTFFDNELQELSSLAQQCWDAVSNSVVEQFRAITVRQAQIEAAKTETASSLALE